MRTPESLLDEVEMLHTRYGIREIFDDTGTFPCGEWLHEFCNGMVERDLAFKIRIGCNMRFGALKEEDYKLMGKAGFRFILYGLESANQNTLDRLAERHDKRDGMGDVQVGEEIRDGSSSHNHDGLSMGDLRRREKNR